MKYSNNETIFENIHSYIKHKFKFNRPIYNKKKLKEKYYDYLDNIDKLKEFEEFEEIER